MNMFCRNCQQDIGNRNDCPFCGYNPALDDPEVAPKAALDYVPPQPVRVVLRTSSNGKATTALILSFFGMLVIPGIMSIIFALSGLAQVKVCRSGTGKAVVAIVLNVIWVILWAAIISSIRRW